MDEVTYRAALRIIEISYEYADPHKNGVFKPLLVDRRYEDVSPYRYQTQQGLFINMAYGLPASLWTPLGEWGCWGDGGARFPEEEFIKRFSYTVYRPFKSDRWGEDGPVYAILRVDDIQLPVPTLKEPSEYIPYNEAKAIWARLVAEHNK